MAQTFTLEQAAERLGLSVEEFKRRLREDWKSVRSFRDGPTLRFRAADIDELARSLGEASDPGVPLGIGAVPLTDSSEEIPIAPPPKPKPKAPEPLLALDDDTAESAEDIFTVPTGDSGVGKKKKGDSDVRLDLTPTAQSDDSEVTEELSLDLPTDGGSGVLRSGSPSSVKLTGPSSGKNGPASGKLGGPRSGKLTASDSARIPGPGSVPAGDDGSSEFELSLDASDSDSFELTLASDSSEEVDLGVMPDDDDGRGKSGIKLDQPADSGVSLERRAADPADESDIEFELSLDPVAPASGRLTGPKTDKKLKKPDDSDSEFELSLDDNSGVTDGLVDELNVEADKGDIFETDFELPVVAEDESGSEVIAVESADTDLENSDFDIAIEDSDAPMDDESASQVVLVDDDAPVEVSEDDAMVLSDDDVQPVSPSRKRRGLLEDDDVLVGEVELDDAPSASKALRGVRQGDEDDTPIRSAPVGPPKWGALPALFLLPCLIVVVLGGLMMFEMIRGQWGYTQPSKPSDALVRGVAKTLDMKVSE